jgi:organic radical activating enzyme
VSKLPIFKIDSNTPPTVMRFEIFLSDYCNYECWYCSKDFNGRTVKWPKLDILLPNFIHLLNYYKNNGKKKFIIHIGGGEPSQWPELVNFVAGIKKHHNCIISLTSNGSRTLRWWEENVKYFDHIGLSVHHERVDPEHLSKVGDIIYKNNIAMWASVLMDPNHWNKCIGIIETLCKSKYDWSISADQIHGQSLEYTEDQKRFLNNRIKRSNNLFYEFFVNKLKRPKYFKPTIYFKNSKEKVSNHWLLLNGYTDFVGWECNVGVDTAFIDKKGDIRGSCGNKLFNKNFYYNIYDVNFKENFSPELTPTICHMSNCWCQPEVNCTKVKIKEYHENH